MDMSKKIKRLQKQADLLVSSSGDLDTAVSKYSAAIELCLPNSEPGRHAKADLLVRRAAARIIQKHHSAALGDCDAALAVVPTCEHAFETKTNVLYLMNQPDEALLTLVAGL